MGTPEIGIAFQADKSPGRYGELAAAAEAYRFDVVSVFADLLDQPPLPALLEMARTTSRVRLGAACLNPYTQHPYEIAGGLAALDATSDGRAYLGLARGAWLEAIGIEQHRPLDYLRDTAAIVRALLSGDDAGYAGAAYRLAPGVRLRYPLPGRVPPIQFWLRRISPGCLLAPRLPFISRRWASFRSRIESGSPLGLCSWRRA